MECILSCVGTAQNCVLKYCPKPSGITNNAHAELNVFRDSNKIKIGTVASGSRLNLAVSDFPLTVALAKNCPDLNNPKCSKNDQNIISESGCYTIMYWGTRLAAPKRPCPIFPS